MLELEWRKWLPKPPVPNDCNAIPFCLDYLFMGQKSTCGPCMTEPSLPGLLEPVLGRPALASHLSASLFRISNPVVCGWTMTGAASVPEAITKPRRNLSVISAIEACAIHGFLRAPAIHGKAHRQGTENP